MYRQMVLRVAAISLTIPTMWNCATDRTSGNGGNGGENEDQGYSAQEGCNIVANAVADRLEECGVSFDRTAGVAAGEQICRQDDAPFFTKKTKAEFDQCMRDSLALMKCGLLCGPEQDAPADPASCKGVFLLSEPGEKIGGLDCNSGEGEGEGIGDGEGEGEGDHDRCLDLQETMVRCDPDTTAETWQSVCTLMVFASACLDAMESAACAEHAKDKPSYHNICFPACEAGTPNHCNDDDTITRCFDMDGYARMRLRCAAVCQQAGLGDYVGTCAKPPQEEQEACWCESGEGEGEGEQGISCLELRMCTQACRSGDQSCLDACYAQASATTQAKLDAMLQCWSENCPGEPDPDDDAWLQCTTDHCNDQTTVCFND